MDLKDLARIIIRGAGLVIIILAINRLPYSVVSLLGSNATWIPRPLWALVVFAPAIASIIGGLVLVGSAENIVSRAFSSERQNGSVDSNYLFALEEVAVVTLGIYIISVTVSDSAYYLYTMLLSSSNTRSIDPKPFDFGAVYWFATRIVCGVILLFGSHGVVILRHRLTEFRPMKNVD